MSDDEKDIFRRRRRQKTDRKPEAQLTGEQQLELERCAVSV